MTAGHLGSQSLRGSIGDLSHDELLLCIQSVKRNHCQLRRRLVNDRPSLVNRSSTNGLLAWVAVVPGDAGDAITGLEHGPNGYPVENRLHLSSHLVGAVLSVK